MRSNDRGRFCERLSLIIVELVTNAAKHAFPDQQPGLIRIEAFYGDGFWHCTVKDSGVGLAAHEALGDNWLRIWHVALVATP